MGCDSFECKLLQRSAHYRRVVLQEMSHLRNVITSQPSSTHTHSTRHRYRKDRFLTARTPPLTCRHLSLVVGMTSPCVYSCGQIALSCPKHAVSLGWYFKGYSIHPPGTANLKYQSVHVDSCGLLRHEGDQCFRGKVRKGQGNYK